MITKLQKELLAPHAAHFQEMMAHVDAASDVELMALYRSCESATSTNCGWDTYAAARWLEKEIQREQAVRVRKNKVA